MSLEQFLAKVAERQPKPFTEETVTAACWFVACHEAEQIFDGLTVKDLGSWIVSGHFPYGPYETVEDLEEWLQDTTDAMESSDTWGWLDFALDRHFGIKREVTGGSARAN